MSGGITVTLSYEERILNALAHVEHGRGDSGLTCDVADAAAIRGVLAPLYAERDEARWIAGALAVALSGAENAPIPAREDAEKALAWAAERRTA